MLADPKTYSRSELHALARVQQHPMQNRLRTLARAFVENLHKRKWKHAAVWLAECENSQLPSLVNFAKGLRQEQSAFVASLRHAWSNGPVEGQITRLKLLKRQMYGRAKLDLLRRPIRAISKCGEEPIFGGRSGPRLTFIIRSGSYCTTQEIIQDLTAGLICPDTYFAA